MSYQGTPTPNGHRPLKFKTGDVIEVLDQTGDWWKVRRKGRGDTRGVGGTFVSLYFLSCKCWGGGLGCVCFFPVGGGGGCCFFFGMLVYLAHNLSLKIV